MPRKTRDLKMPRLTVQEAARLLGVPYEEFKLWVFERVNPSPSEWSRWNNEIDTHERNKSRPLPEFVIRMYLGWLQNAQQPDSPAPSAALPPVQESPRIRERRRAGGK